MFLPLGLHVVLHLVQNGSVLSGGLLPRLLFLSKFAHDCC